MEERRQSARNSGGDAVAAMNQNGGECNDLRARPGPIETVHGFVGERSLEESHSLLEHA